MAHVAFAAPVAGPRSVGCEAMQLRHGRNASPVWQTEQSSGVATKSAFASSVAAVAAAAVAGLAAAGAARVGRRGLRRRVVVAQARQAGGVASAPRVAVVTGGTGEFGASIALGLARSGKYDKILIVGRRDRNARRVIEELHVAGVAAEFRQADLSSQAEVQDLCASLRGMRLSCLVCAAGVTALARRVETIDGHEYHFGLNFLSRFHMVSALMDTLAHGGTPEEPSRVLLVGSGRHWGSPFLGFANLGSTFPLALGQLEDLQLEGQEAYQPWTAFGQAALCNVMLAYEAQKRLRASGVHSVAVSCVDPGPMTTAWSLYGREENRVHAQGIPGWFKETMRYWTRVVESPKTAAESVVQLATTELGTLPCREPQVGFAGYWDRTSPTPSKSWLPWNWGTSYDEVTWARLWEHSSALLARCTGGSCSPAAVAGTLEQALPGSSQEEALDRRKTTREPALA